MRQTKAVAVCVAAGATGVGLLTVGGCPPAPVFPEGGAAGAAPMALPSPAPPVPGTGASCEGDAQCQSGPTVPLCAEGPGSTCDPTTHRCRYEPNPTVPACRCFAGEKVACVSGTGAICPTCGVATCNATSSTAADWGACSGPAQGFPGKSCMGDAQCQGGPGVPSCAAGPSSRCNMTTHKCAFKPNPTVPACPCFGGESATCRMPDGTPATATSTCNATSPTNASWGPCQ